jgi:hypothetical protein
MATLRGRELLSNCTKISEFTAIQIHQVTCLPDFYVVALPWQITVVLKNEDKVECLALNWGSLL